MMSYAGITEKSRALCRIMIIIAAIAAPVSTAITSVALVAILVFWLFSGEVLASLHRSWLNPVGKAILLFYAWLLIGACYADTALPTKIATLLSWQKLLFVFLILGVFYEREWQRRLVHAYVILMFFASMASLPLWLFGITFREQEPGIFMTNHSTQSMGFIAAFLCCMFLAKHPPQPKYRPYIWAAGVLFLFNIFFVSPARSAFLALPPGVFFSGIAFYGHKKLPHILGALFGILLVSVLSSSNLQHRIKVALEENNSYQSSTNETSVGIRRIFYKNTLELIQARPILGYGTSSFASTYGALAASKYQDWRGGKTADPHNQYLFVWLENGAIGLLLFLIYIFTALRQGFRNRPYGPIAAGLLLSICASSLFNSHFKTFSEGNLLALFLGALLAFPPGGQKQPVDKDASESSPSA